MALGLVRQVMGLIDDEDGRLRGGQHHAPAEGVVGQQQVVVGDNHVGVAQGMAGLEKRTLGVEPAFAVGAAPMVGGHAAPAASSTPASQVSSSPFQRPRKVAHHLPPNQAVVHDSSVGKPEFLLLLAVQNLIQTLHAQVAAAAFGQDEVEFEAGPPRPGPAGPARRSAPAGPPWRWRSPRSSPAPGRWGWRPSSRPRSCRCRCPLRWRLGAAARQRRCGRCGLSFPAARAGRESPATQAKRCRRPESAPSIHRSRNSYAKCYAPATSFRHRHSSFWSFWPRHPCPPKAPIFRGCGCPKGFHPRPHLRRPRRAADGPRAKRHPVHRHPPPGQGVRDPQCVERRIARSVDPGRRG